MPILFEMDQMVLKIIPDLIEQLTLNQRATGSTPVRPTNKINDLGRSRQDPLSHKTCFRSVSGNRAGLFSCIATVGLEFFDHTSIPLAYRSNVLRPWWERQRLVSQESAKNCRSFLLLYEPVSKSEDAHYFLEIKLKKHQSLTPKR